MWRCAELRRWSIPRSPARVKVGVEVAVGAICRDHLCDSNSSSRRRSAERYGAWVLDVDGAVEKSKLDEFRTTNVALLGIGAKAGGSWLRIPVTVFMPTDGEPQPLIAKAAAVLLKADRAEWAWELAFLSEREVPARRCAQEVLRELVAARGGSARGVAGLSLLMTARIVGGSTA